MKWRKLKLNSIVKYIKKNNIVTGVFMLLILIIIIFAVFASLTPLHFLDMIRQAAPLGIMAIGQTICLLLGGIDLSVGAVISFTNLVACATMLGDDRNIPIALVLTIGFSLLFGLINGVAIVKIKIPAFLTTLAMSIIIKGITLIYTKGSPIGNIAQSFRGISEAWLFNNSIPVAALIWVVIWAIIAFVMYRTTYGKKIYATGGNHQVAKLSGIRTGLVTVSGYMLSSLLACFAGLMLSAYIGVTSSGLGNPYTLNSIAAVCIGGTTFDGGRGGIAGTFAGVLIIFLIQTFMTMINVPEAGKQLSLGVIIIVMVSLNQKLSKRR